MPSLNYTAAITDNDRIRVNVCEGEVHISREVRTRHGSWEVKKDLGKLSRDEAERLADAIRTGLGSGF